MDLTLRRMRPLDAEKGFAWALSRFSGPGGGADADEECPLGRDWQILERILLADDPEEVGDLAITMGDLLGDDDMGTACFYLPPEEVAIAARFLSSLDIGRAVAGHADTIAGTFRNGDVPEGYAASLVDLLLKIRALYTAAERAGEGVAKLLQG
ncbi:hypothetical protein [Streptomyces sp. NPDC026673]|uniref:DUF1877 family protein n=1 Tax=Streptomyces sp. NPDC026673 TaxID=3155724 RepID=UPI0033F1F775